MLKQTLLALALGAFASVAFGSTVNFTYSGMGGGGNLFDSGTGSFTFSSLSSPVGELDLTDFSLTDSWTVFSNFGQFTYGLGDLTSFSATIVAGQVTDLSFITNAVAVTNNNAALPSKFFEADSLSSAGLRRTDGSVYSSGAITISNVSLSSAPEPSTWGMLILGAGGLLLRRRALSQR